MESVIKHKEEADLEISSARSTPLRRSWHSLKATKSLQFERSKSTHKLTPRSNTVETYVIFVYIITLILMPTYSYGYYSDQEETCDDAPVSFDLFTHHLPSPSHLDHMTQKSKRYMAYICVLCIN